MGYPALWAGRRRGAGSAPGRRTTRAAGPPPFRVPRDEPQSRLPARRADRRAVARGPTRGGGLRAERAAVQAAQGAGGRRRDRPRRAAADDPRRGQRRGGGGGGGDRRYGGAPRGRRSGEGGGARASRPDGRSPDVPARLRG